MKHHKRKGCRIDQQPFVTVIIPVFDMDEQLATCLGALNQQAYPREAFEILVVDNGSAQPPFEVVASAPNARLLSESNPGSYAARNRGLEHARGGVIAFTDADCVPTPQWLTHGVARVVESPDVGLVAGRIELFARNPDRPTAVESYELCRKMRQQNYVRREGFGATANVFTRNDVIERVGRFDAQLKSGGDAEWGQRVVAAGYRVAYCPDAVVGHPARRTLRELHRKVARVVGGSRQRRLEGGAGRAEEQPIRVAKRQGALREVLFDPNLRTFQKLDVLAVSLFVLLVRYMEIARLSIGGSPRR